MSLKVAVLKGGGSLERHVSLRSGAQVEDALERLGHDVVGIDVGPDLVRQLHECAPDVAFVALHGKDGEDGTIQGVLEAIGVPYTGSGPAACMRCTDKALAKYLMVEAGLPTPEFSAFKEETIEGLDIAEALPDIERRLGFPMVVKPASQGSALGVKFAHSSEEVPGAIVGALSYDRKVVIERYIKGRDLAVSVLGGAVPVDGRDAAAGAGAPQALPVVEALPRDEQFFSYDSRYEIGMTTFVCPAALEASVSARAQELALDCFALLGCHGYARVDLMVADGGDELSILEVNVVPGLTETSLLPQAADAVGIGFDELIERILASASSRAGVATLSRRSSS
ncbi:MAG: D-alanine--D-alanine ligase [Acidobacteriota bacterium]|nr:D-alanine--D-alanine ligase [Acidobacteriota bacterium]